jgi:hypothetical protein
MRSWLICAAAGLLACSAQAASARTPLVCLSKDQRLAELAAKHIMTLSAALRSAHVRRSELIDARLCRGPNGLFYLLTLLPRDGKVRRATVDAGIEKPVTGR